MNKWATPHKVIFEDFAIRVLEFRESNLDQTILFVPPQAGHDSEGTVEGIKKDRSLIQCALDNTTGGVYSIDWKGATYARMFENEKSLQDQVERAINATRSDNVHLVSICQGGWVSALLATNKPELVQKLTLVAAPIDTSFESLLKPAQETHIYWYHTAVMWGGGLMRGDWMLKGWKGPNKKLHEEAEKDPKNDDFYRWYNKTQDLAGGWYLWAIDNIFINNRLPDMLDIKCPVNVVVGLTDDITPPAQTLAVQKNCSHKIKVYEVNGGHFGAFGSEHAIHTVYPKLFLDTTLVSRVSQ